MNTQPLSDQSLSEVHGSVDTQKKQSKWRKMMAFFGPAYLVSVGYMDPGNWATDIEGGSRYGYKLIWVLVMSNIMALVLQSLCARLGVVYKRDLAQANRDTYPPIVNIPLYILAEIAIAACDLAEVLGMAIGLKLLFGLPLIWGVAITVLDTFLLLYLQKMGMRRMESFIIGLISVIFLSFIVLMCIAKPDAGLILQGLVPTLPDAKSLYIAIGIIGATVMPHNLYLHSALVQTRKIGDDDASIKKAIKLNTIDSAIALNLALFVNAAILILAGSVFHYNQLHTVASIEQAHQLLSPLVGTKLAPALFAIALICAGQSSTITGTLAGQIVMEGYLQLRINPWVRRLVTRSVAIVPAILVILFLGEDKVDEMLVFSQVILSIQLAFAVITLIIFVSDKNKMKQFAIKPLLLFVSVVIAGLILFLNFKLIFGDAIEFIQSSSNTLAIALVVIGLVFFVLLLLGTIFLPFINKTKSKTGIHSVQKEIEEIYIPQNKIIALGLDFSDMDSKVISYALAQGNAQTHYVLMHILESAPAKILGSNTGDTESVNDADQLMIYVKALQDKGLRASAQIGYRNRVKEIARITNESKADLLVLGAHGHKGLMDYLYGETINSVRHLVEVPVLVVK
jgi:manganese transport protein